MDKNLKKIDTKIMYTQFFAGDEGDIAAQELLASLEVEGFEHSLEWDDFKKGYVVTWFEVVQATVRYGKTISEYYRLYGDDYRNGDLWSYDEKEFVDGTTESQTEMIYWFINHRFYETYE